MHTNREFLQVSGLLSVDRGFQLGRSYSVADAGDEPARSDFTLEALGANEKVLASAPVKATTACALGSLPVELLSGRVELPESAASIRLRSLSAVLWESVVTERPTLTVDADVRTVQRRGKLRLHLHYSTPLDGATLQIFFQWQQGASEVIDLCAPSERLDIDLSTVPGGDACRVWVHYASGLRSVVRATDTFALPVLPHELQIVLPAPDAMVRQGVPLDLVGQVIDPQALDNLALQEGLVWSVDGQQVAAGPMATIMVDRVGLHTLELVHHGSQAGQKQTFTVWADSGGPAPASQWDDTDLR